MKTSRWFASRKQRTSRQGFTGRMAGSSSSDRGAALVEFAMVLGLLLVLVMGIFEMGTAWSKSQLVTQAARTGARSGSQLGVHYASDEYVVQAIEAALGEAAPNLDRIVIFRATSPNGELPPACKTVRSPGVAGQCSVYELSDFSNYGTWAPGSWTPGSRSNTLTSPDYLGVRVEIKEPMLTGFFGNGTLDINDTAIMRIEPDAGNP